jgi:hypothetical protein
MAGQLRKNGPVKTPADLIGKHIGMYDWVASRSIWYRHFCSSSMCCRRASNGGSAHIETPRAPKIWAGSVKIHPTAKTGAHHHGHLESVVYVLNDRARMRWG